VNGAKEEAKKQAGNAKDQAEQTGTSSHIPVGTRLTA